MQPVMKWWGGPALDSKSWKETLVLERRQEGDTDITGIFFEMDFAVDIHAGESYFVFEVIEGVTVDMIKRYSCS